MAESTARSTNEKNRAVIEKFYTALGENDFELLAPLHRDDIVMNVLGRSPVSGRFEGREACFGPDGVATRVFHRIGPGYQFGAEWRIVAVDEPYVVGFSRGEGASANGGRYDQTYCQVFRLEDGLIVEMHEFLDTVVVEDALYGNRLENPQADPALPFSIAQQP